jgi:hypothetical protein
VRRLQRQSGKKKKARTKAQKVRRTLAIVLLSGGVLLETVANVVQLVESETVQDAVVGLETPAQKAYRWLQRTFE